MNLSTHPAFRNVDPAFVNNLQQTLASSSYKSELEIIGALMAISNEAKAKNITMTSEMQVALLDYFKGRLPVNKRAQFDAVLKMFMNAKK